MIRVWEHGSSQENFKKLYMNWSSTPNTLLGFVESYGQAWVNTKLKDALTSDNTQVEEYYTKPQELIDKMNIVIIQGNWSAKSVTD